MHARVCEGRNVSVGCVPDFCTVPPPPLLLSNPLQISAVAGTAVAAAAAVVTFGSNFEVRPQRLSRD